MNKIKLNKDDLSVYIWVLVIPCLMAIVLLQLYFSFRPKEIIAEKGLLTVIYKRLFLFDQKKIFKLDDIDAILANPVSHPRGKLGCLCAKVTLVHGFGEECTLFVDRRSLPEKAIEDSRKLASMISEKMGTSFEYIEPERWF